MTHDYRSTIIEYIRKAARPVDKFSHQARLYRLTTEIGAGMPYDDDIVFAAVWMHDLGVFIGHRPEELEALSRWDNVAYVVKQAPALLRSFGFPEAKITSTIDAMRTHLPNNDPQSIEGVILRDADILEQLGAVSILRTVSKVGRDTRFPTFTEALQTLERQATTLPAQLRLPKAQALAAERVSTIQSFLAAAASEAGGVPW